MLPPNEAAAEAAYKFLQNNYPGGEYIAPHWRSGPYRTVALNGTPGGWTFSVLLAAYPPVIQHLPYVDHDVVDWQALYVLPAFVTRLLEWEQDEYESYTINTDINETYSEMPSDKELVDVFATAMYLRCASALSDDIEALNQTVESVDPLAFMTAWNTLTTAKGRYGLRACELEDVIELVKSAVEIAANPS